MMTALFRMLTWAEHHGMPKEELLDLLNDLAGKESPAESDAGQDLENVLKQGEPDPARRANLLCRLMNIDPDEEIEAEEAAGRIAFLPLILHAVREIIETSDTREQALEALDAVLS